MQTLAHWSNGATLEAPADSRFADIINPATGEVSSRVALASAETTAEVIAAAHAAFPAWRDTSLARRAQILFAFRELLNKRKGELAEIITAEHGKVLPTPSARSPAAWRSSSSPAASRTCSRAASPRTPPPRSTCTRSASRSASSAIITPFNFPAMVPMWFFPIAIAAGNTVVLKPSEKDPTAALWLAELWQEAGLPDGVFNVVHGDKESPSTRC